MAHIHIQRKRRPLWPWVLGLIAGALLVWLLMRTLGNQPDPGDQEPIDNTTTDHKISDKPAPDTKQL